jgi:ABC-type antimicrobial peptide transport system permease subunit
MREFIVLVVLGFRRRRVAWMLFLESLMIAVPAAATGALLASPLAKAAGIPRLLDGVTEVRFEFSPAVVGMVVAIGVVMGILGAMQPALHISRVDLVSRSQ